MTEQSVNGKNMHSSNAPGISDPETIWKNDVMQKLKLFIKMDEYLRKEREGKSSVELLELKKRRLFRSHVRIRSRFHMP